MADIRFISPLDVYIQFKGETFSARQKTVAGQLLPITKYKQSQ